MQNRTYKFADTGEDLPYCLFASSKVSKDKKNPLIVYLHGLGIGPGLICQGKVIDLAEEGGYILVAPMGYSADALYGLPLPVMRGGPQLPANLAELSEKSEKDVLNVLGMIRQEFNVDERRTYLMGHSAGGAGTFFLGSKHAKEWAALAPIAPAAFMWNANRAAILGGIKDGGVPVIVLQGDADTDVPATSTRLWVETMKELSMNHKYIEVLGAGHGDIIEKGMPDIFSFFKEHTK